MLVAGIDVGSVSADAVVLGDRGVISHSIVPTGADSVASAHLALETALEGTGIGREEVEYVVGTGYGRFIIPFANKNVTEISCHARGTNVLFPSARTILDMGGQDCKAIRCDETGKVVSFVMNDKCAAGAGRFFEIMADVLGQRLEDIGGMSLQAGGEAKVSGVCAVFARSEMVRLLRKGIRKDDILGALHDAVTSRVLSLLRRVVIEGDLVITGGIAKNVGMVERVRRQAGVRVLVPEEPQIVGALGAALFARERLRTARLASVFNAQEKVA